jgi:arsenate reductase-like glutaredoxin family protein
MKRVDYYLTESQIEQLKKLSKQSGLSVSEIIRRALDKYFEKNNSYE